MKARNLFLSLIAVAAICSCNKEMDEPVADSEVLSEDTYIKVNIVAANDDTKGTDGGTSAGTAQEHEVKNVMLAFFTSSGDFVEAREYNDFTWENSASANVERVSSVVVVLKGKTIVPRQVIAVLNYTPELKAAVEGVATRTAFYQLIADSPISNISGEYFLMSNSVYMDGASVNYYNQIADSHMYTGDTPPAGYKPLDIYVERVAAKVNVSGTPTGIIQTITLHSGNELHYYPTITGVNLTSTANKSFLLKHIHDYTGESGWTWPFDQWNDPINRRSYWANSYDGSAGYTKVSYAGIGTETEWTRYYNENTNHANHSQLLVSASIKQAADAYTVNPSDPVIGDLVKFGPTYYTKDDFLTVVANEVAALGVKVGGVAFDKSSLVIAPKTGFYSSVALATSVAFDDPAMKTTTETKLADYDDILYWKDGKSYFFTHVEHFGPDAGVNTFGLVRNHLYDITINSIRGLGTPVVSETDPIDPEKPSDLDYNLAAKINILRWKVVSQSVDLN